MKQEEQPKVNKPRPDMQNQKVEYDKLIRIASRDINGRLNLYTGLTKIKGVSWAMSNALCRVMNLDKKRRVDSLSEVEIKKIEDFLKSPQVPIYVLNRRADLDTGQNKHLIGTALDLQKEFDIKRLKKIKSYRGLRHASGLPVRGQRTRAHFRKNRRKGTGIKKD